VLWTPYGYGHLIYLSELKERKRGPKKRKQNEKVDDGNDGGRPDEGEIAHAGADDPDPVSVVGGKGPDPNSDDSGSSSDSDSSAGDVGGASDSD